MEPSSATHGGMDWLGSEPCVGRGWGRPCILPIGVWLPCSGANYTYHALVSHEDYEWAVGEGNWFVTQSRGNICYAARSRPNRGGVGNSALRWLHKEVLHRAVGPPPTPRHIIGDHINGNPLDCRRGNLRWATHQMNARNLHGIAALQLDLFHAPLSQT